MGVSCRGPSAHMPSYDCFIFINPIHAPTPLTRDDIVSCPHVPPSVTTSHCCPSVCLSPCRQLRVSCDTSVLICVSGVCVCFTGYILVSTFIYTISHIAPRFVTFITYTLWFLFCFCFVSAPFCARKEVETWYGSTRYHNLMLQYQYLFLGNIIN